MIAKDFDDKQAAAYLAAIIDGEGSVTYHESGGSRSVKIVNTDPTIIEACKDCLDILGIGYTFHFPTRKKEHWRPITVLTIYGRDNLEKLQDLVPLQSENKRDRLRTYVASYVYPKINHVVVEDLYLQGFSSTQIAEMVGSTKKTILHSLHKSGTPMRKGGRYDRRRS